MAVEDNPSETDWHSVYTEQLPRVYNFFRYRLGILDSALAEDLTAATFEKAWRHREQYRRNLAAFTTWLFTIARNVADDHYRRTHRSVPLDGLRGVAQPSVPLDELVEQRDRAARLNQLLAQLPERERELIALKYGAEMSNRAIAALMNLSEANVAQILHRLLTRLRQDPRVQNG